MAATTIAVIGAAAAAASAANSIAQSRKAAKNAAAGGGSQVDIGALDTQARDTAQRNAADSAALEARYNPGAAELRAGSLQALLSQITRPAAGDALVDKVYSGAGAPIAIGYDSPALRAAIAKASGDLSLGGALPADVRALVARKALANAGEVSGNLGLGRDLVPRDLGLTSLQLEQQRLQNALTAGGAEAQLNQGNAAMALDASKFSRTNLLDSGSFLNSIVNGDFARTLAAAQLGQNIAQPASGLDPGSIGNLAVGNTTAMTAAQQQAAALRAQTNAQIGQLGGQLLGQGLYYMNKPTTTYTPPPAAPAYTAPNYSALPGYYGNPGY